jgi:hypothetical protein
VDGPAAGEQPLHELAPDEPGRAGDQVGQRQWVSP